MTKRRTIRRTLVELLCLLMAGMACMSGAAFAAPGSSSASVSWTGATTITSPTSQTGKTYTSTKADQNALLVNASGSVSISNPTVSKSGGTSASDTYSFYGINSGIMVKGGGTTTITGGTITTNAAGANGVFSYGANNGTTNAAGDGTTVVISGTKITTTGAGSGGIMTTYGGTTKATNLTVTTSGGSSAPIRTDRGGGWVTVDGGTYTSNGLGSPAIYSTADVKVSNATLVSNKSEGVCIEGNGSIALANCKLTASNTQRNGDAQYLDTVMVYQSMSGDATGTGSMFSMIGGTLTSKKGHVFHVTNTNATLNLSGATIVNSDSDNTLLSVVNDGWSGNANIATVNASGQTLVGDIIVSSAASSKSSSPSSLYLNLSDGSTFTGTIDDGAGGKNFKIVRVNIGAGSAWTLTGDSYVTSASGDGIVDYAGHTLYVDGVAYTASNPYALASGTSGNASEQMGSAGGSGGSQNGGPAAPDNGSAPSAPGGNGNPGAAPGAPAKTTSTQTSWKRVWGKTAPLTMQAIAKQFGSSSTAIVSTSSSYKDALAASALAGHHHALVLTTAKSSLTSQTKSAIQTAGVKTVYILGSTSNISAKVEKQLKAVPGVTSVKRISATTPSQRAVAAAKATGRRSDTVIIATQNSYKDALSIAPYSYATESPILYAETNKSLSSATLSFIKSAGFRKAIIVGGPLALPTSIETQLVKAGIGKSGIARLAGSDAYATSQRIAQWSTGALGNGTYGTHKGAALSTVRFAPMMRMNANNLAVTTGQNWKDALAGAALCGKNRSVMLLADTKGGNHYANAVAFCKANKGIIGNAYVFGGTSAVSAATWNALVASTK